MPKKGQRETPVGTTSEVVMVSNPMRKATPGDAAVAVDIASAAPVVAAKPPVKKLSEEEFISKLDELRQQAYNLANRLRSNKASIRAQAMAVLPAALIQVMTFTLLLQDPSALPKENFANIQLKKFLAATLPAWSTIYLTVKMFGGKFPWLQRKLQAFLQPGVVLMGGITVAEKMGLPIPAQALFGSTLLALVSNGMKQGPVVGGTARLAKQFERLFAQRPESYPQVQQATEEGWFASLYAKGIPRVTEFFSQASGKLGLGTASNFVADNTSAAVNKVLEVLGFGLSKIGLGKVIEASGQKLVGFSKEKFPRKLKPFEWQAVAKVNYQNTDNPQIARLKQRLDLMKARLQRKGEKLWHEVEAFYLKRANGPTGKQQFDALMPGFIVQAVVHAGYLPKGLAEISPEFFAGSLLPYMLHTAMQSALGYSNYSPTSWIRGAALSLAVTQGVQKLFGGLTKMIESAVSLDPWTLFPAAITMSILALGRVTNANVIKACVPEFIALNKKLEAQVELAQELSAVINEVNAVKPGRGLTESLKEKVAKMDRALPLYTRGKRRRVKTPVKAASSAEVKAGAAETKKDGLAGPSASSSTLGKVRFFAPPKPAAKNKEAMFEFRTAGASGLT